jgi:GDP-4-dehydro-6-deoxy-D-mannose reductase
MKVLITGITGFVGSHMADYLIKNHPDIEIYGIARWRSSRHNIRHIENQVKLLECDLCDMVSIQSVITRVKPDRIFHLAAQSFVPTSWIAPSATFEVNVIGNLNLFEAVRSAKIDPLIQIACSSEEYGMVYENEVPIKETNPLRPLSPYAVSKVSQDFLSYQYFMSYGLKLVRTRGFNHTGPRRGDVFVCSDFAKQVASIELGLKEPVIHVGNLEAKRDFTDVRDMVRAYWLALEKSEYGEVYNIASGKAWSIQEVLDMLLEMSTAKIEVQTDPKRLRPSDVPILLGDYSKFSDQTGWKPEILFPETLKDILNYWREELRRPLPVKV